MKLVTARMFLGINAVINAVPMVVCTLLMLFRPRKSTKATTTAGVSSAKTPFGKRCIHASLLCDAKVLGEGLKMENFQKWLGEGAKGLLGQGGQRPLPLGAKESCTGAKDSWETFAPWVPN